MRLRGGTAVPRRSDGGVDLLRTDRPITPLERGTPRLDVSLPGAPVDGVRTP